MRRAPLSLKVLLIALMNIVLLGGLLLIFARVEYQFNLSSFLLAPARATVISVSRLLELELSHVPMPMWNKVLAQYSSRYPAQFYLFDHNLNRLAGNNVQLPASVAEAIQKDPFAKTHEGGLPDGRRPPPRDDYGPPNREGPADEGPPPPRRHRGWPRVGEGGDSPAISFGPDGNRSGQYFPASESGLDLIRSSNPTRYWVGVRLPLWTTDRQEPLHATLIWEIPALWTEPAFFDYRPWLGVLAAVVVSLVVCWWPLVRDLTKTLQRITGATGQIADGQFDVQLPTNRRDELGHLSQSINVMSTRLAGYVNGQKRFLGDIAHELSSPVARIQAGLGILEQRVSGPAEGYVADVREDVEHMSGLVNELLAFSKSQVSRKASILSAVPLLPLVTKVVEREGSGKIVADRTIESSPSVLAVPELLDRALSNVVRNAVRYAGQDGPITISCQQERDSISIAVSDEGPGLPETELENVFRPFYRPEFARQRETGGSGLGLAIVRDCVESCRGSVLCRNRSPRGLDVIIRLRAVET